MFVLNEIPITLPILLLSGVILISDFSRGISDGICISGVSRAYSLYGLLNQPSSAFLAIRYIVPSDPIDTLCGKLPPP